MENLGLIILEILTSIAGAILFFVVVGLIRKLIRFTWTRKQ